MDSEVPNASASPTSVTYRSSPEHIRYLKGLYPLLLLRRSWLYISLALLIPTVLMLLAGHLLALAIAYTVVLGYLIWVYAIHNRRQQFDPRAFCTSTVTLGDDAISSESEHGFSRVSWDLVDEVRRYEKYLLNITRGYSLFSVVPISAFADAAHVDDYHASLLTHLDAPRVPLRPRITRATASESMQVHVEPMKVTVRQAVVTNLKRLGFALLAIFGSMYFDRVFATVGSLIGFAFAVVAVHRLAIFMSPRRTRFWVRQQELATTESFTLRDEGLHRLSGHTEVLDRWSALDSVENLHNHVMFNGVAPVQIPENAFPDPDSLNQFVATAKSWIDAHSVENTDVAGRVPALPAAAEADANPYASPKVDSVAKRTGVQVYEFELTDVEAEAAIKEMGRWAGLSAMILVVILGAVVAAVLSGLDLNRLLMLQFLIGWAVLCGVAFFFSRSLSLSSSRKSLNAGGLLGTGQKRVALFGSSVWVAADGEDQKLPFPKLRWVRSGKQHLVLKQKKKLLIIPKAAMDPDDFDELRKQLKSSGIVRQ